VRDLFWTEQATADLAAIHAFISQNSPHFAAVIVRRLISAVDQLIAFPESGRTVPEYEDPGVREIVRREYRIIYRLVGEEQIHIVTIHHGAKPL
jgi:addiction module RelE/StbE family toxin